MNSPSDDEINEYIKMEEDTIEEYTKVNPYPD